MRTSTIRTRRLTSRSNRTTIRTNREDGEETKARIIEAAGRLFAERGFSEVTSKEICEAAGTNLTAVNYHFGSREGLYLRVLEMMHEHFSDPELYAELERSNMDARSKLEQLLYRLVDNVFDRESWQMRLWARETVAPSQLAQEMMQERVAPKFEAMENLLSEITLVPKGSLALSFCFMNVMAPFMVLLIMGKHKNSPETKVLEMGARRVTHNLREMVFVGLDNFAEKYAAGGLDFDI